MKRVKTVLAVAAALCSASWVVAQWLPRTDPAPPGTFMQMRPQDLRRLPPSVLQQALSGAIDPADMEAAVGFAPQPQTIGTTALVQKQFITHWVTHYTTVVEGFNEDTVNAATIDGRASGQKIADGPGAPVGDLYYWTISDGSVETYSWQAPAGPTCGSTINNGLSRYFVTWVWVPTARAAWLFFGSSDSYRVWLNRTQVLSHAAAGTEPWVVDANKVQVPLIKGWNLVTVKQSFGQLGPSTDPDTNNRYKFFSLRFASDATGTPYTDIAGTFNPNSGDTQQPFSEESHTLFANMAHLAGAGGSQWRTDLVAFNGIHIPWVYGVRYYREGNNSGTADASTTFIAPPFGSVSFSDALPGLLGVAAQEKGYIVVDGQMAFYLDHYYTNNWVTDRAYNQSATGTYANTVPGFGYSSWAVATGWTKVISGIRNGRFRTNFGIAPAINAGASTTVRLTIVDPSLASPVQHDFTGVNGYWQVNDVFHAMGIGNLYTDSATLYVQMTNNATGTYWFPFATVQDGNPNNGEGGTSDPAFLTSSSTAAYPPLP
jgi:hypothetical protein